MNKNRVYFLFLVTLVALFVSATVACNAHEHSYGEPFVYKAATCTENGIMRRECKKCDDSVPGHFKDATIQRLHHNWSEGEVVEEVTYLKGGQIVFTCLNDSSHTRTVEVDPLGIPSVFHGEWFSPDETYSLVIDERSIYFYENSVWLIISDVDGKNGELTFRCNYTLYKVTADENKLSVTDGAGTVFYVRESDLPPKIDSVPEEFLGIFVSEDGSEEYRAEMTKNGLTFYEGGIKRIVYDVVFSETGVSFKFSDGGQERSYELLFEDSHILLKEVGAVEFLDELDDIDSVAEKISRIPDIFRGDWRTVSEHTEYRVVVEGNSLNFYIAGVNFDITGLRHVDKEGGTAGKIIFMSDSREYELSFPYIDSDLFVGEAYNYLELTDTFSGEVYRLYVLAPAFYGVYISEDGMYRLDISRSGVVFSRKNGIAMTEITITDFTFGKDDFGFVCGNTLYTFGFELHSTVLRMYKDKETVASFFKDGTKEKPFKFDSFVGEHSIVLNESRDDENLFVYYEYTAKASGIYKFSYPDDFEFLIVKIEDKTDNRIIASWNISREAYEFVLKESHVYTIAFGSVNFGDDTDFILDIVEVDFNIEINYLGVWQTADFDAYSGLGHKLEITADGVELDGVFRSLDDIYPNDFGLGYNFSYIDGDKTCFVSFTLQMDDAAGVPVLLTEITTGDETSTFRLYAPDKMPHYSVGSEENPEKLTQANFAAEYKVDFKGTTIRYYSIEVTVDCVYTLTAITQNLVFAIELDGKTVFSFTADKDSLSAVFELKAENTYIIWVSDENNDGSSATSVSFKITEGGDIASASIPREILDISWDLGSDGSVIALSEYRFVYDNGFLHTECNVNSVSKDESGKTVIKGSKNSVKRTLIFDPEALTLTLVNNNVDDSVIAVYKPKSVGENDIRLQDCGNHPDKPDSGNSENSYYKGVKRIYGQYDYFENIEKYKHSRARERVYE